MNQVLNDPQQKRLARELALQILFQTEFTSPVPAKDFLELFEGSVPAPTLAVAEAILNGVKKHKVEIDQLLQKASQHWKIERMAIVDRNILRIAVFEMKFQTDPTKPSIAINEAIDIAKKFGTTDSGGFVNGLLDQVRKDFGWQ